MEDIKESYRALEGGWIFLFKKKVVVPFFLFFPYFLFTTLLFFFEFWGHPIGDFK
tara:strand:- start:1989 stop:2153 length:165 start_codon:yes stop_codon:yes gene_type:complete